MNHLIVFPGRDLGREHATSLEGQAAGIPGSSARPGAVLLGIVIALVLVAVLGGAVVTLTTTSTYDELLADNYNRAYYMAESGGRYAVPKVMKDKNQAFTDLNGMTYAVGTQKFQLAVDLTSGAPNAILTSTGIVNEGLWNESRAVIRYRVAPGTSDTNTNEFFDSVTDLNKYDTPSGKGWGTWTISSVQGDNALDVATGAPGSDGKPSIIGFKTSSTSVPNFCKAWRGDYGGEPYTLSYDIQTKIMNTSTDYYMAGISVRLSGVSGGNVQGLGFSLIRAHGDNEAGPNDVDGINFDNWYNVSTKVGGVTTTTNTIPALVDQPAVVFWQDTTGAGTHGSRNILAYRLLSSTTGVVDSAGLLQNWTTLLVRVTEIKDPSTGTKHNEFKVFVGDNSSRADGDTIPFNYSGSPTSADYRQGSPRQVSTLTNRSLPWPPGDPGSTGGVFSTTTANDKLSLISGWATVPVTGVTVNTLSMTGQSHQFSSDSGCTPSGTTACNYAYPSAILSTTLGTTASSLTGTNPCSYSEPEAGLHAAGNSSYLTYFDDLAVNFPGGGSGTGEVIQY